MMRKMILAMAVAVFVTAAVAESGKTADSGKTEVMASVNQFVDAFNKGDAKAAAALCTDETSIIDEFPPHVWNGAGACTTWMNDYDADAKKRGVTDGRVTLGTPKHVNVSDTHAYVVIPSSYTYKKQGKPVKETNCMFTLALQKGAGGWRVLGWSWAKN